MALDNEKPSRGKRRERRLTEKQEAFARAYLKTGKATEAYREVYASEGMSQRALEVEASRLLNHPEVSLRVRELQERATTEAVLTRAWVIERLMRNADQAIGMGDVAGSNKALELLGKIDEMGLFVERVKTDNRHTHAAEPLSPFADFLTGAIGPGTKGETEEPLQN